jgi:hypothetical protein
VADRESHLVPVVLVIARDLFSDTVGRQAEEVPEPVTAKITANDHPQSALAVTAMVTPANAANMVTFPARAHDR